MSNTRQIGTYTLFIYRSGNHYVGVCLELDIIDNGTDRGELTERMKKSVESYVRYVCADSRYDDGMLNRPAPKRYWRLCNKYLKDASRLESNRNGGKATGRISDFLFSTQSLKGLCPA